MDVARTWMTLGDWNDGERPWFRVTLHDTAEDLRRAARRLRPGVDWTDTGACFHPAPWRERYDQDSDTFVRSGPRLMGTLRFARSNLFTEIVAHECAHAAAFVYRRYWHEDGGLGDDCTDDREEMFAYVLGDITRIVFDALRALGQDVPIDPPAAA